MPAVRLYRALDRLLVRDFDLLGNDIGAELTLEALDDDIHVSLTGAGDDRLPRFGITLIVEGRIFLRHPP